MSLSRASKRRTLLFWGALFGLAVLIIEGLSLVAILLFNSVLDENISRTSKIFSQQTQRIEAFIEQSGSTLLSFDSLLGWRYTPGYQAGKHAINGQGIRSDHEYSTLPLPGAVRVSAFGNSFVYGSEVTNAESWAAQLEERFSNIELLNYGVGGYGTDQAYLRFVSEGTTLAPNIVIIGFAPINLRRNVNVYRRFISTREYPLVKPRFVLNDGALVLVPNPIQRLTDYERYLEQPANITELGEHDYWYTPEIYENPLYDVSATVRFISYLWARVHDKYLDEDRITSGGVFNRRSEAFRIQTALLKTFSENVRAAGADPLIVIFPDRDSVVRGFRGEKRVFDPLVDYLEDAGLDHVDLTAAFLASGAIGEIDSWFRPGGHYSPVGNRIAANWMGREIQTRSKMSASP